MKATKLRKFIEADGWINVRTGKHHIYRHPTKPGQLTVPKGNKDMATGTLNQILKIAGLK